MNPSTDLKNSPRCKPTIIEKYLLVLKKVLNSVLLMFSTINISKNKRQPTFLTSSRTSLTLNCQGLSQSNSRLFLASTIVEVPWLRLPGTEGSRTPFHEDTKQTTTCFSDVYWPPECLSRLSRMSRTQVFLGMFASRHHPSFSGRHPLSSNLKQTLWNLYCFGGVPSQAAISIVLAFSFYRVV